MSEGEPLASRAFALLLDDVAAKRPTPGGGAVAASVGALAASLASMVLNYSIGRKGLEACGELQSTTAAALLRARALLLELADEDAAAYAALRGVQKAARAGGADAAASRAACERAMGVPAQIVGASAGVLRHLEEALAAGALNRWLLSDLAIAAELAASAARSALWMVRVNEPSVVEAGGDAGVARQAERAADAATAAAERIAAAVSGSIASSDAGG